MKRLVPLGPALLASPTLMAPGAAAHVALAHVALVIRSADYSMRMAPEAMSGSAGVRADAWSRGRSMLIGCSR